MIFASLIGTTIEFYDFYIYATAAVLVFPALFFPNQTEANQLLSSFAVFGVAFAWLLLSETPRPVQVLGGALILLGVIGVKLGEPRLDAAAPAGTAP